MKTINSDLVLLENVIKVANRSRDLVFLLVKRIHGSFLREKKQVITWINGSMVCLFTLIVCKKKETNVIYVYSVCRLEITTGN